MPWLEPYLLNQTAAFTLILARVGALLGTAPLFGAQAAPIRVRALLAVALSLLILPSHGAPLTSADSILSDGMNLVLFSQMIILEVIVGAMLGQGVMVILSGVQMAGQIVAQMSGMAIGELFDPGFDSSVSIFGTMFYYVTFATFVAIGGLRMAIEALLNTFTWAPPGRVSLGEDYADLMVTLLSQSFDLALRAAAPLLIALLLSTIVLGLISRTMPQINVIVVGFSANALLTLGLCFATIGGIAWVFQQPLEDALINLSQTVQSTESAVP
ncbi:flagellar biosynthesis protein FliR [Posidoniimonas polymericola]|uniref:Flagellar biosynthesis protein FliR n=1 Tax=Posidoniimonas polymericola TaxID=2528002 RepID=A0A5C5YQU6_9BACT|nr:flagellar biosynthetic protein FliR [Posidoniimonas polymericola]TWT77233.1 flagellar biosynthesis protein FliR [Posidoniimonas polymericola]